MNNNESFEIRYNEKTGLWEEVKEPYMILEIQTEEDFNYIQSALELKKNEGEQWKDTGLIAQYSDENKRLSDENMKLKDLLRAAMEDMKISKCGNDCRTCGEWRGEPPFCEGKYKWRHADEAKELLRGETE